MALFSNIKGRPIIQFGLVYCLVYEFVFFSEVFDTSIISFEYVNLLSSNTASYVSVA